MLVSVVVLDARRLLASQASVPGLIRRVQRLLWRAERSSRGDGRLE